MSTVKGRGRRLEIEVDRALAAATAELLEQFAARPGFYRGSRAVARLGALEPAEVELAAFRDALAAEGIVLDGVAGAEGLGSLAERLGLAYLGRGDAAVAALPRPVRLARDVRLSEDARSLIADFAGARADLARRRSRVADAEPASAAVAIPPPPPGAPAGVATLYHRGGLRGGQALHNLGHLVVVGDVNPGAELVASGDVVVVGALRGVAHAGAQGDRGARVVALELAPTQLRIADLIAAEARVGAGPEIAYVEGGRIAVAPLAAAPLLPGPAR